ncbi:MAG: hypothetical protein JWQ75_2775 [Pseudarthrobacter sp.]|nr:hypothetical protein [Pseudarthrobacter sp.]
MENKFCYTKKFRGRLSARQWARRAGSHKTNFQSVMYTTGKLRYADCQFVAVSRVTWEQQAGS